MSKLPFVPENLPSQLVQDEDDSDGDDNGPECFPWGESFPKNLKQGKP